MSISWIIVWQLDTVNSTYDVSVNNFFEFKVLLSKSLIALAQNLLYLGIDEKPYCDDVKNVALSMSASKTSKYSLFAEINEKYSKNHSSLLHSFLCPLEEFCCTRRNSGAPGGILFHLEEVCGTWQNSVSIARFLGPMPDFCVNRGNSISLTEFLFLIGGGYTNFTNQFTDIYIYGF